MWNGTDDFVGVVGELAEYQRGVKETERERWVNAM